MILCIETSTKVCSVALSDNRKLLALKESIDEKHSHAENLTLHIEEIFKQAHVAMKDIDAVAVSKGPGSYTGLRIGVSTAKGVCYALNKPLLAINTLQAMCYSDKILYLHSLPNLQAELLDQSEKLLPEQASLTPTLFCPMIDAKRMEVYCAVYEKNLSEIKKTAAEIIDEKSFSDLLQNNKIIFFGDGSEKCKSKISHSNAIFIEGVNPSAKSMIVIAENYFSENKFEDVAYFEPFYLKDFVSGSSNPPVHIL